MSGSRISPGLLPRRVLSETELDAVRANEGERSKLALDRARTEPERYGLSQHFDVEAGRVITDEYGSTHVYLKASYQGARVYTQATVHIDSSGQEYFPFRPPQALESATPVAPALTAGQALGRRYFKRSPPSASATLSYMPHYAFNGVAYAITGFDPVYLVSDGFDLGSTWHIDAINGEKLRAVSNLNEIVYHRGYSQYSGTVSLKTQTTYSGQWYRLCDLTKHTTSAICTHWNMDDSGNRLDSPQVVIDSNDVWGNGMSPPFGATSGLTSTTGQTVAVDAHFGIHNAWTLFDRVFGQRKGPLPGGAPISIVIRADPCVAGANDADIQFGQACEDSGPLVTPDITGHELAHMFYPLSGNAECSGQAGGSCEAFGDLFGTLAEHYLRGGALANGSTTVPNSATGANWTLAEQTGSTTRYMYKPSMDGVSEDIADLTRDPSEGNRHDMTGPLNRAAYFIAQGAEPYSFLPGSNNDRASVLLLQGVTGIGNTDVGRIAMGARGYVGNGSYLEIRDAWMISAIDRYGWCAEPTKVVEDAFAAVGIGPAADRSAPEITLDVTQQDDELSMDVEVVEPRGIRFPIEVFLDGQLISSQNVSSFHLDHPSAALSSGPHEVRVRASDTECNQATEVTSVNVDNSAPVFQNITKLGLAKFPVFNVDISDTSAVTLEVFVGNILLATVTQSPYTVQIDTSNWPTGVYELTFVATDSHGNAASETYTILADNTPPILALSAEGSSPPFLIDAAVIDNTSVTVIMKEDGVEFATVTTAPWEAYYTPTSPGPHTITAEAIDAYLNVSTVEIAAPEDLTPPDVIFEYTHSGSPQIRVDVTDTCDIQYPCQVYLDGDLLANATDTPYIKDWTPGTLTSGNHIVEVEVEDNCG
ncbi:MAG: M4 family metallopeptidase, partial [Polyangiaceae bacterium]